MKTRSGQYSLVGMWATCQLSGQGAKSMYSPGYPGQEMEPRTPGEGRTHGAHGAGDAKSFCLKNKEHFIR